jgi:choline-sulfatase
VILLTVDSLRADVFADARGLVPNLARLAKQSVVFDNHRALTSFTAQSVPTLLSGRHTSTLYRSGYFFAGYAASNEFFPEVLQSAGVRTLGLHSHLYFTRGKGLEQGFDVWEVVQGITFNERTDEHTTSPKTTARFIELLSARENVEKQFFAWTHYMDPHHEYVEHAESPDFGNSPRDAYHNEVHFTDRHIGKFLDWAEKQPWWERTALIVSSDHGEAFGEHRMVQHAHELWDELLRVPLMIRVPGLEPRRVATPHTHLELAPTIMELMGTETNMAFESRSLVPELEGAVAGAPKAMAFELTADNVQEARRAVISGGYKLIRFGGGRGQREALFDLEKDPFEKNDLARSDPARLEQMRGVLEETFAKIPSVAPYGGMKLKGGGTANGPMKPTIASL